MSEQIFRCVTIRQEDKDRFDDALSDILCWLEGFQAAGGKYGPGSISVLRDIRDMIDRAYHTTATGQDNLPRRIADSLFKPRLGRSRVIRGKISADYHADVVAAIADVLKGES